MLPALFRICIIRTASKDSCRLISARLWSPHKAQSERLFRSFGPTSLSIYESATIEHAEICRCNGYWLRSVHGCCRPILLQHQKDGAASQNRNPNSDGGRCNAVLCTIFIHALKLLSLREKTRPRWCRPPDRSCNPCIGDSLRVQGALDRDRLVGDIIRYLWRISTVWNRFLSFSALFPCARMSGSNDLDSNYRTNRPG